MRLADARACWAIRSIGTLTPMGPHVHGPVDQT